MIRIFILIVAAIFYSDAAKQGICGKITWVEGNQMPGPGSRPKPQGVVREIYVYEITTSDQVKRDGGFFSEVRSKLVAQAFSKADGSYKISLPPGEYSVFTKEEKGLFANIYDHKGAINTVIVEQGKYTTLNISINYKAAY